jgi:hypothetical protein
MSFEAVAWAVRVSHGRGLSWPAKGVLWHLPNRFNRDQGKGCFPAQKCLANDCEVSHSQLIVHLSEFERVGLIRRVLRFDRKSGRRLPTQYRFAFEEGFEPLPEGAVPSEDKQPDLPLATDQNPEIGVGGNKEDPAPPTPISTDSQLRLAGDVIEAETLSETLSCVRDDSAVELDLTFVEFWRVHPRPKDRDDCQQLFLEAVLGGEDAKAIIEAARRYATENLGNRMMYVCQSDNGLKQDRWRDGDVSDRHDAGTADVVEFWAAKIHEGRHVPLIAVSSSMAREMVQRGSVRPEELSRIGIYP